MRYAYHDLGEQEEGSTAVVRWRGSPANVLMLDPVNFSKYCEATMPVVPSAGGRYRRSPARVPIPQDGRWYVVIDLGGRSGHANPTVEVLPREDEQPRTAHQKQALTNVS
jgi:hypothetical protein